MEVVPVSPLRTASLLWQPRRGSFALTVVAKATFHLAPGECTPAREQEHPNEGDNHWNDDEARSIYSPNDLAPFKRKVDVLLVGNAFAAPTQVARSVMARLQVAEVDKSIEVFCDRSFGQDGSMREGSRFQRMALRWERAAGGPDTSNPVGMRWDARDAYGKLVVPNLQPPGVHVGSPDARFEPVGFGPIAPSWPSRVAKLGRAAATWSAFEWHRQPLPPEVDPSYFNVAPPDQQIDQLHEEERILLEHLHVQHVSLTTRLPGVRPRVVMMGRAQPVDVDMKADTLWIDTDRGICTVTWRGQIPLDSPMQQGRVYVAQEGRGERLTAADIARLAGVAAPPSSRRSEEGTRVVMGGSGEVETMAIKARPATLVDPTRQQSGVDWGLPFAAKAPAPESDPNRQRSRVDGLPFAQKLGAAQQAPPASWREEVDRTATELPAGMPPPPPPTPYVPPPAPPPPPAVMLPQVSAPSLGSAPVGPPPAPADKMSSGSPWAGGGAPSAFRDERPPEPQTVGTLAAQGAPPIAPAPAVAPVAAPRPARGAREVVDLLWFDPECVPRIRETQRFEDILKELEPKEEEPSFDDDDPFEIKQAEDEEEPKQKADRRVVFAVVAKATASDSEELPAVLAEAVDEEGRFIPPLVVVSGELLLPFDEIATLKATCAAVTPLTAGDPKLKSTVDAVNELLTTPWLQSSSTGVAEGLTQKVKEAFAQGNRMLPATYLESHTERTLLEQRQFQKRTVFGEPRLRGQITTGGTQTAPIPSYLPEPLTNQLPMFQRYRVRALAEVHMQQDQYESHPIALKVVALGRISSFSRRM